MDNMDKLQKVYISEIAGDVIKTWRNFVDNTGAKLFSEVEFDPILEKIRFTLQNNGEPYDFEVKIDINQRMPFTRANAEVIGILRELKILPPPPDNSYRINSMSSL